MKNFSILTLICLLTINICFANDFDDIMRGINSSIDALSNLKRAGQELLDNNSEEEKPAVQEIPNPQNPQKPQEKIKQSLIQVCNQDGTYTYVNREGIPILSNLTEPLTFINDAAVVNDGNKRGLVNTAGEYLTPLIYDAVYYANEDMWAFFFSTVNGVKMGYMDSQGNQIMQAIPVDILLNSGYGYDYKFYNGLALYREPYNNKFGYLDKTGKLVIDTIYTWAEPFKDEITAVTLGNNYGYIDTTGKVVLPFKYNIADSFSDGMAAVYDRKTDSWGYIDKTGNFVIPPRFGSFEGGDGEIIAYPFVDGITAVYLGKGQTLRNQRHKDAFALIDKTGKILKRYDSLNAIYDEKGEYMYFAISGDKYYTLDSHGNVISVE